jgi:TolB-like protein
MKKLWILALVVILSTCASGGSSSAGAGSTGSANLDFAIQQASKEINDALPPGTKVALLNFSSDSDVFSDYVIEEMSIALVKERKLTVVDRREIDLIRGEMNFQMSGDVSDESAQEIGMMLGAQSIISGSIINLGENYRFRTKVINVISAAIQASSSISVADDPQIRHLLSQGRGGSTPQRATVQGGVQQGNISITIANNTGSTIKLAVFNPADSFDVSDIQELNIMENLRNRESRKVALPPLNMNLKYTVTVADLNNDFYAKWNIVFTPDMTITFIPSDKLPSTAPTTPLAHTYKIGDTGPAGGLIFYDKGNNSGGWRYLEAAPRDLPRKLNATRESIDITDCSERAVGKGRENTQVIMAEADKRGGGFGWAAQACVALNVNGNNDWFLPSRDEMHYMYGNLHMQGLGNFKNERYWSSTGYNYYGSRHFWWEDFSNGVQDTAGATNNEYWIRPIREVPGP